MLQLICVFFTKNKISVNLIYLENNKGIWNKVTTNHGSCDKDFLKNSPKWMNPKFWKFCKINVQKDAVHRSLFVLKCLKFCLVHFSLSHSLSLSRTPKHTQIYISLTHTLYILLSLFLFHICLFLTVPNTLTFSHTHSLSLCLSVSLSVSLFLFLSFFCLSQWILKWNLCV